MMSMDRMATLGLNQRLSRKNMAIELMIERRMAGALKCERITSYGSAKDVLLKTPEELEILRDHG